MKYELQKILSARVLWLLLLLIIVINAWLFYGYCTSPVDDNLRVTMLDIRDQYSRYERGEDLHARYEYLSEALYLDSENQINAGRELAVLEATLVRIDEAENYTDTLEEIRKNYLVISSLGSYGDEQSFSYKTLQESTEIYGSLIGLTPEVSFSGGIELLSKWRLTDAFAVGFALSGALILGIQDRRLGFIALLRPTKRGHGHLYYNKGLATLAIMVCASVSLYGVNFAIAGNVLGFGNLARPLQSVYGFSLCPMSISVGQYLLLFFILKTLWAVIIGLLLLAICSGIDALIPALGMSIILGLLSFLMAQQQSLWLRSLSLYATADVASLFSGCLFLDFFSQPLRQTAVVICFWFFIIICSQLLGLILHCRKSAVLAAKERRTLSLLPGNHTALSVHEAYKMFLSRGGLALLAALLAIQIIDYHDFDGSEDKYYIEYAAVLSGEPNIEKDIFLENEAKRFSEISEQISYYAQMYSGDNETRQRIIAPLEQALIPQEAFERARVQYEALDNGEVFVCATGYQRLYSSRGIDDDLANTAKLFTALSIALCGVFAAEHETGVYLLICAAGQSKRVYRIKLFVSMTFMLLCMLLVYLPQYLAVINKFGLPLLCAQASSLDMFSRFPSWVSLRGVLIITNVARLAICTAATILVLALSKKIGDSVIVCAVVLPALLLSVLIVKLFLFA